MKDSFNSEKSIIKGKKQVLKGIEEGKFNKILIAADNDLHFNNEIIRKCEDKGANYQVCCTKSELGKFCKIDVPCGVVGVIKS